MVLPKLMGKIFEFLFIQVLLVVTLVAEIIENIIDGKGK